MSWSVFECAEAELQTGPCFVVLPIVKADQKKCMFELMFVHVFEILISAEGLVFRLQKLKGYFNHSFSEVNCTTWWHRAG